MARKDQPYLPLYVQDFLTDERLAECSAATTGVYIRLMCLMHKSERYGTILLKQKSKQKDKQILNFALQVAKHLPYDYEIIEASLVELLEEGVLKIEGDYLIQKRMENDGRVSETRSLTGSKGGKKTQLKNKDFAKANFKANSDIENDNENEVVVNTNNKANEIFKKMLLESESILGTVCFQLKIPTHDAKALREMFVNQVEATEEHHNNYSDYSKHFVNWAKLNKHLLEDKGKLATAIDTHNEALQLLAKERNGEY